MPVPSITAQRLKLFMQRGHLHHLGGQILVVAGMLLMSSVLLLGMNVSGLQKSFGWVQETDDELIQLSEVEKQLVTMELSVRGYALTADGVFLRYIATERRQLDAAMKDLARSMANDPGPMKIAMGRLQELVGKRVRQLSNLAAPGSTAQVADAIRSSDYRDTMRRTRAQLAEMRSSELMELSDRQASASLQARQSFGLAVGMVLLAFLCGAVGLACMRFRRNRL
jgi:CHASE3 domain sensor protein